MQLEMMGSIVEMIVLFGKQWWEIFYLIIIRSDILWFSN